MVCDWCASMKRVIICWTGKHACGKCETSLCDMRWDASCVCRFDWATTNTWCFLMSAIFFSGSARCATTKRKTTMMRGNSCWTKKTRSSEWPAIVRRSVWSVTLVRKHSMFTCTPETACVLCFIFCNLILMEVWVSQCLLYQMQLHAFCQNVRWNWNNCPFLHRTLHATCYRVTVFVTAGKFFWNLDISVLQKTQFVVRWRVPLWLEIRTYSPCVCDCHQSLEWMIVSQRFLYCRNSKPTFEKAREEASTRSEGDISETGAYCIGELRFGSLMDVIQCLKDLTHFRVLIGIADRSCRWVFFFFLILKLVCFAAG